MKPSFLCHLSLTQNPPCLISWSIKTLYFFCSTIANLDSSKITSIRINKQNYANFYENSLKTLNYRVISAFLKVFRGIFCC